MTYDTCVGHVQLQIQLYRRAGPQCKGGCHSMQSVEDSRERVRSRRHTACDEQAQNCSVVNLCKELQGPYSTSRLGLLSHNSTKPYSTCEIQSSLAGLCAECFVAATLRRCMPFLYCSVFPSQTCLLNCNSSPTTSHRSTQDPAQAEAAAAHLVCARRPPALQERALPCEPPAP